MTESAEIRFLKAPGKFGPQEELLQAPPTGSGAEGRNRTDTRLPPLDFESSVTLAFATTAEVRTKAVYYANITLGDIGIHHSM